MNEAVVPDLNLYVDRGSSTLATLVLFVPMSTAVPTTTAAYGAPMTYGATYAAPTMSYAAPTMSYAAPASYVRWGEVVNS